MTPRHAKAIGQLLLLVAFVAQWFVLDALRESETSMRQFTLQYRSARVESLDLQQLFASTRDITHLRKAASNDKTTVLFMLIEAEADPALVVSTTDSLQKLEGEIVDGTSFDTFQSAAIKAEAQAVTAFGNRAKALRLRSSVAWWAVVVFSVSALLLLAYGEYRDFPGGAPKTTANSRPARRK
jgi:hypothetical protein